MYFVSVCNPRQEQELKVEITTGEKWVILPIN